MRNLGIRSRVQQDFRIEMFTSGDEVVLKRPNLLDQLNKILQMPPENVDEAIQLSFKRTEPLTVD